MSDLKGCPFCGGEAEIKHQSFGVAGLIQCQRCKVLFMVPWNKAETPFALAETWNQRAREEREEREERGA